MIMIKNKKGTDMMVDSQSFLLYTVIIKGTDERMMFLVENDHEAESEFMFPNIAATSVGTGLATVINELTKVLDIDIEELELSELTNACINELRLPLFVFSYEYDSDPNELLTKKAGYTWQFSDSFTDTLQKYDISGVPSFN